MASQQRLQANLCCQLMTGFSASGDFDGDLDMISFDPMLIDLVKATEIGIAAMCMEEHFQAVDTRRGQWLLLIFTRVFEMCWTKGVKRLFLEGKTMRKVVGGGRRTEAEEESRGWSSGPGGCTRRRPGRRRNNGRRSSGGVHQARGPGPHPSRPGPGLCICWEGDRGSFTRRRCSHPASKLLAASCRWLSSGTARVQGRCRSTKKIWQWRTDRARDRQPRVPNVAFWTPRN